MEGQRKDASGGKSSIYEVFTYKGSHFDDDNKVILVQNGLPGFGASRQLIPLAWKAAASVW